MRVAPSSSTIKSYTPVFFNLVHAIQCVMPDWTTRPMMSRTILASIALVMNCSFVWAETAASILVAIKPQQDAYENCVAGRAKSFAGSPDSVEAIVKSAIAACAAERRALSGALGGAGLAPGALANALNAIDAQVSQVASKAVLEERDSH
jgi:hypothetical protein